ncbi:amidohydrolase [uncultured Eubacterium sp.]|uniref:amidohydrolase n=1 Tax=uncultured Eubacterium sp. TaxID=165185 RepID=UPI0025DBAC6D|nr:amidohydrolase [uncultured Eubacterium sp.]
MIKFTNGLVLDKYFNIIKEDVFVDGDSIVAIGEYDKTADTVYDLNGNLLMPSFKNAHTHSAMTFGRSFADDLPLQPWLYDKIFPLEAKLTPQDIYDLSMLAFLEYLTSGTSACFDMYYFPEMMAKASVDFGFRTVMTSGLNNFKESVNAVEDYYNKFNNYDSLVSYKLGFHAEYTTDKELIKGIAKLAEKYQAPVFTHASETKSEVEDCIKRNGMSPTKYLNELGIFNYGGGAYHSVWIDDEDIEIYKEKGIWAVINACSNAKLASGIAPVSKLLKNGVKVAVGTDGASSNNALDMFREMYTICATQKLNDKDAASTDANDILKASTIGSARCMGLTDCDVIDVDKKADLIVIDMHRPSMQPINNITKNLVYSGGKDIVKMTMINGKILYDNGEFKNIDIEKIYANAQAVIDRIR